MSKIRISSMCHDMHVFIPQECRSLPRGPNVSTEDYFAGSRLGFSLYVARSWTRDRKRWTVLISRVLEKTSKYAAVCAMHAVGPLMHPGIRKARFWSDGPSQFKSGLYMGLPVPLRK